MRRPWLPLVLAGLLGGLLSGIFGVGGGIVMVPLLTLLVGMDQRRAAATSLAAIVLSAASGSVTYVARGAFDLTAVVALAAGSIVGAVIGTALLKRLPITVLRWLFVLLLVVIAVRMLLPPPEPAGPVPLTLVPIALLVLMGLLVGIASGLFGIGGGVLIVPGLVLLAGLGELVAKGTSLLVMIPTGITGTWRNLRNGLVVLRDALFVGVPAIAAATVGASIAFLLRPPLSNTLFAVLLLAIVVQQVLRILRRPKPRSAAA